MMHCDFISTTIDITLSDDRYNEIIALIVYPNGIIRCTINSSVFANQSRFPQTSFSSQNLTIWKWIIVASIFQKIWFVFSLKPWFFIIWNCDLSHFLFLKLCDQKLGIFLCPPTQHVTYQSDIPARKIATLVHFFSFVNHFGFRQRLADHEDPQ